MNDKNPYASIAKYEAPKKESYDKDRDVQYGEMMIRKKAPEPKGYVKYHAYKAQTDHSGERR